MKGQKMKKLNIGTLDKAKNQKNFSLSLKVYERLFNISNTACGVPVSIPKAIEFLINFYLFLFLLIVYYFLYIICIILAL